MKFPRIVLGVLVLVLVAEGALLWTQRRILQDLEQRSALALSLRKQLTDTGRNVAELRASVANARVHADTLQKRLAALEQKQAQATNAKTNPQSRAQANQRLFAQAIIKALDQKAFRDALGVVDRTWNLQQTAPFLRSLGLDPARVERAIDLIDQLMLATADANQAATAGGLDYKDRLALIQQTQQDAAAQLRSYLGDQAYNAYQDWNREMSVRSITDRLQESLSYTSSPLSGTQASELTQAMYGTIPAASKPPAIGVGALAPMGNGGVPNVSDAELAAAKPILTPAQYARLAELAASQRALRALQKGGGI